MNENRIPKLKLIVKPVIDWPSLISIYDSELEIIVSDKLDKYGIVKKDPWSFIGLLGHADNPYQAAKEQTASILSQLSYSFLVRMFRMDWFEAIINTQLSSHKRTRQSEHDEVLAFVSGNLNDWKHAIQMKLYDDENPYVQAFYFQVMDAFNKEGILDCIINRNNLPKSLKPI